MKLHRFWIAAVAFALCLSVIPGCGGGGGAGAGAGGTAPSGDTGGGETSGPAYTEPSTINAANFNAAQAEGRNGGLIDVANVALGYVGASAKSDSRLKFQVINGGTTYNYDMPNDGTPVICPLNMGDGSYEFRIMQNTSGNDYAQMTSATASVKLQNEFEPFLRPNIFCEFNDNSACVIQARQLAAGAENEGDVLRSVYDWLVTNISYDTAKASQLANTTGYIPNPDETLSSRRGICFDYASLAAAMFRSLNIPCQIVTGYVSPDNIYHAWNMIYIDGSWVSAHISVEADKWTRIDVTFAAGGADAQYIGDGATYTERYVY